MASDHDDFEDDNWVKNSIDARLPSRAAAIGDGFLPKVSKTTDMSDETDDADEGRSATEADCPSTLELSFNELQLMRVEARVTSSASAVDNGVSVITRRLYLGDVHTNSWQRAAYRPRAYQDPLVAGDSREVLKIWQFCLECCA